MEHNIKRCSRSSSSNGKNNLIKSHGPIAFLCLDSEEVAIIWKSLGMIGTLGHTLARTWDWGPSLYLAWAQLITARQSAVGPVPRAREDVRDGALSESCDTLRTLVQRCYMTLGCHYVKWQWYNNSRVTMMMMRVWPLASDIRDIIMSDRRSSILDMIRGRGKEAARRERDAPGLERWVLGSEDLMQSRVSFVHFDKLWCICGKKLQTPIISNCNISGHHLFICIFGCWCRGHSQAVRRIGGKELKNSANVFGSAKRPVYLVLAFTNVWVIMSEKWYIDQICCGSNLQSCCCCCCCCCNCCWILNAICKRKQHRGLLQI